MDRQNKIVGVVGRKGSGKSTILKVVLKNERRLLVFNTMGEHDWAQDQIDNLDTLTKYMEQVQKPTEHFRAAFTPGQTKGAELLDEFDVVSDDVYHTGNMTFAIEELPSLTKSAGYMQPSLSRLFRLGRHRSLNLVWTAQRMAEVPRGVTGATDYFIFFQQTEPGDIKALEYRCGAECAQMVTQLGLHDFLTYDVITREIGGMGNFKQEQSEILVPGAIVQAQPARNDLWEGTEYAEA